MRTSRAYLNYGRWVAECPESGCNDARLVYEVDPRTGHPTGRRLAGDVCANGHPFRIEMPPPDVEAQIVAAVADRAEDGDKAWYPQGHPRALLTGRPHGQSPAELRAEGCEVAAFRAAGRDRDRDRIREVLAGLGIEVRPDGTFEGSL